MFSLPRTTTTTTTGGSTAEAEGTSDANPIHLAGVTELEFETLLRYFYKRSGRSFFSILGALADAFPRSPRPR